jgi:hypothetical protein
MNMFLSRRANAQQPKLFVGMILILIFAEALALYGLIGKFRHWGQKPCWTVQLWVRTRSPFSLLLLGILDYSIVAGCVRVVQPLLCSPVAMRVCLISRTCYALIIICKIRDLGVFC